MFTKMKNKILAATWKDWLVIGLWVLTLAMLFAFVITAATMDKTAGTKIVAVDAKTKTIHATQAWIAKTGTTAGHLDKAFSFSLDGGKDAAGKALTWAPITGFTTPTTGLTKDTIGTFTLVKHNTTVHGVDYNNTIAALGLVFMLSIFSALITTVIFKFLERKRGAK